jgi:hypothetical protein
VGVTSASRGDKPVPCPSGPRYAWLVTIDEYVRFIEHNGCPILLIDFQGCQPREFLERIRYARSVIGRQPKASIRTLTVVTDARFNRQVSDAMKEYAAHNKPYVRVAAVVGLSGLQEIVYNVIIKLTGRNMATFSDVAAAKDFLAADPSE